MEVVISIIVILGSAVGIFFAGVSYGKTAKARKLRREEDAPRREGIFSTYSDDDLIAARKEFEKDLGYQLSYPSLRASTQQRIRQIDEEIKWREENANKDPLEGFSSHKEDIKSFDKLFQDMSAMVNFRKSKS